MFTVFNQSLQDHPMLAAVLAAAPNPYLSMLGEVIERTGRLVAAWQDVGFVHAVLNTGA